MLRPLEPDDAPALHALCTRPQVARGLTFHPAEPVETFRARLERPGPADLAVGLWEGGALLGALVLDVPAPVRRRHGALAWLAVAPERWGQGLGRALLGAALEAAGRWHNLLRVELECNAGDARAARLAGRLGLRLEGTRRQALALEGGWVDRQLWAWLRADAPSAQPPPPALPQRGAALAEGALRIRPATAADAAAYWALGQEPSVYWGTLGLPYSGVQGWRGRLGGNVQSGTLSFLAELEGRPVGTLGLHPHPGVRERHAWGLGMSVHPEAQGRGVGGALLGHALSLADDFLGARRVELEVYTDNARAVALYRRHGFVEEGVRRCEAWRDGAYVDSMLMGRVRG